MEYTIATEDHGKLATRQTVKAGNLQPGDWILRNPAPQDALMVDLHQLSVILVTKVELDVAQKTVDLTLSEKPSSCEAEKLLSILCAKEVPMDLNFEVLRNN